MNRHFGLRRSPKHRRDLDREFKKSKKCCCFRGGTKLSNCFGSWDNLALEVPPSNVNSDHICDHSSLISDHKPPARKTLPSITKHPGARRYEAGLSLGYLSRSGKNNTGSLQFHHFNSIEEHIKYYRENKPNSLYYPSAEAAQSQQDEEVMVAEPEQCICFNVPPITLSFGQTVAGMTHSGGGDVALPGSSLTLTQTKPPTCTLTQRVYHIRHPHTFPLRALGKAIMPSYASLIMRVPSLDPSSDNYWVPVNAVFQKQGDNNQQQSWEGAGGDQQSDTSSSDTQPQEFPSLRRKTTWRHADSFKKRSSTKRSTRRCVKYEDKISEEPEDAATTTSHPSSTGGEGGEGGGGEAGSAMPQLSTTTHRSFTGPGRLLSGQLRSSSTHPTHLQDIVVGIQKSPYERLMPKLHITSCGRRVVRKAESSNKRMVRAESVDTASHDSAEKPSDASLRSTADGTCGTEDCSGSGRGAGPMKKVDCLCDGHEEGLSLNKLDITSENSGVEDWTGEDADFSTLKLELKPVSASSHKNSNQDSSKNVSLTFSKPKKLFRLTSTHTRLLQSAKPLTERQDTSKSSTVSATPRAQFTPRRGKYYPSQDAKHRLVLEKEEGPMAQGAFGMQSNPATKCMLRCQERRKLRLGSRRVGREEEAAANRKKIQVYLIKTKKSLDDILPHLISEKYCLESSKPVMDLYDE